MIGIVARSDDSGLGNQTRAITQLLKPSKVLVVDSTGFRKGAVQHPEWYDGFNAYVVHGFLANRDCIKFLSTGVKHLFFAETAYNNAFYSFAKTKGVRTYTQINPEFFENWQHPYMPLPTVILLPSRWMEEDIRALLPNHPIVYLPPPLFPQLFKEARDKNISRTGRRRFVHIVGKPASKDRAGTLSLLEALSYSKADYELVIRCQEDSEHINYTQDRRLSWDVQNINDHQELYRDFDVCIQPRRYGGLNLVANEALMSALPVIMTDISPNNTVLPPEWLIPSKIVDTLQTRRKVDVYEADARALARKLDALAIATDNDLMAMKAQAFEIALAEYSPEALRPRYEEVMNSWW